MRIFFCFSFLAVLFVVFTADDAFAAKKSRKSRYTQQARYSELVMDADTGKVVHQVNGDARRYPASLTKMMTLYMLFDALESGNVKKSTPLTVSKHAASQPKTNIGLREGETITVDQAIRALVVHSANDVAVVVAEALGRSQTHFAAMMTAKAKKLGMQNTVFRNASGLPNPGQYTTARDMAKLGRALRRDFSQHYRYFSTQAFYWKGAPYRSHNRVLGRFEGADGIKTGYINASGFNLVTSARRDDGFDAIGVVMGGSTSRARDDRMVVMLNGMHRQWASLTGATGYQVASREESVPVPSEHPLRGKAAQDKTSHKMTKVVLVDKPRAASPEFKLHVTKEVEKPSSPSFSIGLISAAYAEESSGFQPPVIREEGRGNQTLDYQLAMLEQEKPLNGWDSKDGKSWGIQVGAYADEDQARDAVEKALYSAGKELKGADVAITGRQDIHRARIANLTKDQADAACTKLAKARQQCFALLIR